jgi:hypothetical protein
MRLSPTQTDEKTLTKFGAEAVYLIKNRNFSELAERFGYALAYDRSVAQAIEEDFEQCLSEAEIQSSQNSSSIEVKYFKPNTVPLYAVVECITPINEEATVLIELVVTGGDEKYITLEQISYVA